MDPLTRIRRDGVGANSTTDVSVLSRDFLYSLTCAGSHHLSFYVFLHYFLYSPTGSSSQHHCSPISSGVCLNLLHSRTTVRTLFTTRAAVSARATRSTLSGALELPNYRLAMSRRAFSYRAAASWNHLPPTTASSGTYTEFLRHVAD